MENGKEKLLREIQILSFAAVETGLYLDAYPDNQEALAYFRKITAELREKTSAYEEAYGPLTPLGVRAEGRWEWTEGPWPWEEN